MITQNKTHRFTMGKPIGKTLARNDMFGSFIILRDLLQPRAIHCNTLFPLACKYNYKWPRDYGKL
jgi:hypothetical protein